MGGKRKNEEKERGRRERIVGMGERKRKVREKRKSC